MYLLDTDSLSILEHGGETARLLIAKLSILEANELAVTIISYEEQMRGWLSYLARSRSIQAQVEAYKRLKKQLENYCAISVIDFDERSAVEFQRLKKLYPRLGSMDLKIAAIAIANDAILLTRNLKDFGQIEELRSEDWTV
ncbi:MAG: PIN domain-containing protein [Oscillatoriaceae cyanobacterium Prado104]|jgi:tRNA(fMet)-specific endonuclease VapC|nr:PIN domain-containing protein [Oscillatoriaceae cyanobacterium Prado104]